MANDLVPWTARDTGLLGILWESRQKALWDRAFGLLDVLDVAMIFDQSPLMEVLNHGERDPQAPGRDESA